MLLWQESTSSVKKGAQDSNMKYLILQVDDLEAEAKTLEDRVRGVGRVEENNRKEQIRLIELVTQAQIEMDGIQVSP